MKKRWISILLALMLASMGSLTASAHSGRTDGSGGHKDNKNASGLGSYHYHCGGHPPHLHTNGCPYKGGSATPKPNATQKPSKPTTPKATAAPMSTPYALENGVVQGYTTGKNINVRMEAGKNAKKLLTIAKSGSEIEILEQTTNSKGEVWCRIRYQGKEGYILADYVDGEDLLDMAASPLPTAKAS